MSWTREDWECLLGGLLMGEIVLLVVVLTL